jgi:D-alanyl-D-alanine carboxypeptidase/D-alanyl-D-alanine-endopeptidase (penicillin-binding protein 4)
VSPRLLALLLCLALTACATTRQASSPAAAGASENTNRAPHPLAASLDALLHTPGADAALWGVFVQSLDSGETLYDHQGNRLMLPASAMKLVTLAVAAELLGWNYRYQTEVLSAAPLVDGVLQGDLIVRGGGDPSINTAGDTETPVFDGWTTTLREQGISGVNGRVIGDDNQVEEAAPGYGWSWDDLPYGYAAPTGALLHQDNMVRLTVHAGSVFGGDTLVEVSPRVSGVQVVNRVETDLAYTEAELTLHRGMDGTLEIRGGIPAGSSPVSRTAAVANPTVFFVRALKQSLEQGGIEVSGDAVDLDDIDGRDIGGALRVLARHESPPLSALATTLMQTSHNLYAETLLSTLDQNRRPRTASSGRAAVSDLLATWDIGPSRVIVADGSGLSRYNYVTARALVDVLRRMHEQPQHTDAFLQALPVAGVSGTLASRMVGTAADGNVRAKTGSMANVRTLAGYVTGADGERLAFAVLANNFPGSPDPILTVIDQLVDRLARSTRADSGR